MDEMVAKLSDRSVVTSKVLRSEGQTPETPMKGTPAVRGPIGTQPARQTKPARTRLKLANCVTSVSSAPIPKAGNTQSMIEMARIVIRNAGRPLAVQAIPEKIRSTFGIAAAKSLPRMLIKRARRSKCGFYLTSDGLIGLIEAAPIGSTPRA
jgi:hypothetical protein